MVLLGSLQKDRNKSKTSKTKLLCKFEKKLRLIFLIEIVLVIDINERG